MSNQRVALRSQGHRCAVLQKWENRTRPMAGLNVPIGIQVLETIALSIRWSELVGVTVPARLRMDRDRVLRIGTSYTQSLPTVGVCFGTFNDG